VAQRFSAAITALFCMAALAAEVKMYVARDFFRSPLGYLALQFVDEVLKKDHVARVLLR